MKAKRSVGLGLLLAFSLTACSGGGVLSMSSGHDHGDGGGTGVTYQVIYDYAENGGTSASKATAAVASGAAVDLTPVANKTSWSFIGWNTDKDATQGLPSYTVTAEDVRLYAIYAKALTATFQDYTGPGLTSRTATAVMYNKATNAAITIPAQNTYSGGEGSAWTPRGWSSSTAADAEPLSSGLQLISADTAFYGLYQRPTFTLSYDANGGAPTPLSQTAVQYANSYAIAEQATPPLILAAAISKQDAAFAGWALGSPTGAKYHAGDSIQIDADTMMFALWTPQYPQYLGVHGPTGWNENLPDSISQATIDEILNIVGNKGKPERRLAVSHTFSYLQTPVDPLKSSLNNALQLAKTNDIPIIIHLDGVNWWDYRPDLWNFWDQTTPAYKQGYNPANVDNVERYDWGTETGTAVRVGWRNWGSQMRVAPAPNLASPRLRAVQTEVLDELLPIIKAWYDGLPADKEYLLGGVVFGWELTPYVQAWYFENGNDLLNQPPANDPLAQWASAWSENGTGNILALGYAAAQTLGLQPERGAIKKETIDAICKDYLEFLIQTAVRHGIEPKRIITHSIVPGFYTKRGGGHSGSAAISDVVEVVPGWSMYFANYRDLTSTIDKAGGRPWAAIETTPDENILNATYLKGLMSFKNNRYVNIFNWDQIKGKSSIIGAVKETLDE